MERRNNGEVLADTLTLDGKRVLDVGCGDGHLVRLMTRHGARVTGVEIDETRVERARGAEAEGDETYEVARGEALPFDDAAFDVVVYFNSLHHVPIEHQGAALAEASRVLKPGGTCYVCEPVAEGAHFTLMQPAHDETEVRAAALAAIGASAFSIDREMTYVHAVRYRNFAAFRKRITTINPHVADDFDDLDADLRARFDKLGQTGEKGVEFDQPMRVHVLRKG